MRHIVKILILVVVSIISYWAGCQTWYTDINGVPHYFNTEEARLEEIKYSNALFEGLHWWYRQNTNWWEYQFKNTKEYKNIEYVNNGDWEDFYAPNWY